MRLPGWYPPILAYHRVHPDGSRQTPTVSPERFERQMTLLARRWNPVALERMADGAEGKAALPPRPVAVTFDDGTEDFYPFAFPVLRRLRIPATVFLIADRLGHPGFLSEARILEMARSGIAFGSHGLSHRYLPELSDPELWENVSGSKRKLEALGLTVSSFSYPAGGFTPAVRAAVSQAGYQAACTTNRGLRRFPADRWALRRIGMRGTVRSGLGMAWRCSGYHGFNRRLRAPS